MDKLAIIVLKMRLDQRIDFLNRALRHLQAAETEVLVLPTVPNRLEGIKIRYAIQNAQQAVKEMLKEEKAAVEELDAGACSECGISYVLEGDTTGKCEECR